MTANVKHETADVTCTACGYRCIIERDTVELTDGGQNELEEAFNKSLRLLPTVQRGDIRCPECDGLFRETDGGEYDGLGNFDLS